MPVQTPLVGEHRVPRNAGLDLFRVNSNSTIYGTHLYGNVRVVQVIQRSSLAGMPYIVQGVYAFVRSQTAHCRQSLPQVHGPVRSKENPTPKKETRVNFSAQALANMQLIWTKCAKQKQSQWGYAFEHVERSVEACIDHGERIVDTARTATGERSSRETPTVLMKRKNLLVRFVRQNDAYIIIDVIFTGLTKADMDTYAEAGVDAEFINGLDEVIATGL